MKARTKDILIACSILALVAVVARFGVRKVEVGLYVECKANLKNMATALEMYSTDNAGRYPERLGSLTPAYLISIPPCPATGVDTYSQAYSKGIVPDAYTICCKGANHRRTSETWDGSWHYEPSEWTDFPADYPSYGSYYGCLLP